MDKIDWSVATGVKGFPLRSTSLDWQFDSMEFAFIRSLYQEVRSFATSGYVALSGGDNAAGVIDSAWILDLNRMEFFLMIGQDTSAFVNPPVIGDNFSYDGVLDPTTMSDATTANAHQIRQLALYDRLPTGTDVLYSNLKFFRYHQLRSKVLPIGDWDMDATASVSVTHGLTLADIRSIDVHIIEDGGVNLIPLNSAGSFSADGTNVNLSRTNAGAFDTTQFNATSFNRGWVTIRYYGNLF